MCGTICGLPHKSSPDHPVLIDHFLEKAFEFDVDAVSDGTTVVVGGVMQHIEEAGVHSGDSSSVLPPYNITREQYEILVEYTRKLAKALSVCGLVNVQFAMQRGIIYVLEVNPRASRSVPFVSKATGVPLAKIAAKAMVGKSLSEFDIRDMSLAIGHVAVKESVFPFHKFPRSSMFLGPEMRSTGEVMGIDRLTGLAVVKARIASGNRLPDCRNTVCYSFRRRQTSACRRNVARLCRSWLPHSCDRWYQ